jgi:hypothetical protein
MHSQEFKDNYGKSASRRERERDRERERKKRTMCFLLLH